MAAKTTARDAANSAAGRAAVVSQTGTTEEALAFARRQASADGAPLMVVAGSLYVVTGLARRLITLGRRWSAGRPARRLLAGAAGLAVLAALAAFWTLRGEVRGW